MDMVDILEQQMERNAKLIENVEPEQLSGETPCKGFDCRGLVNHMVGGAVAFAGMVAGDPYPAGAEVPDFAADEPAATYREANERFLATVREPGFMERTTEFPFGSMPGAQALGVVLTETVLHGWDLARATDQDAELDPILAETLLQGGRQAISPEWRNPEGNPFGPEVEVPEDATPTEKLVAFFGRTP